MLPTRQNTMLPALFLCPCPTGGQKACLQKALLKDPKEPGTQGKGPTKQGNINLCSKILPACFSLSLSPCP